MPGHDLPAVLHAIAADRSRSPDLRSSVLLALDELPGPDALAAALELVDCDDLGAQVWAGLVIADRALEAHRELLARLVAGWPSDLPVPDGEELRDLLR